MPNHVHLIAVSQSADRLKRAIGEVHCHYTRVVNFREGWRGYLWQGQFASFVLDHSHEHTGRPLGEDAFLARLEENLGRILRRQKPGPKPGLSS